MSFRPFIDANVSLSSLQDEMNRLFERIWHGGVSAGPFDGQQWAPTIDLFEQGDDYLLFAEMPGVDPASIDVSYVGNVLTIRGEKPRPAGVAQSDRPLRQERRYGTFCRTVELPGGADFDRLAAQCHAGVLTITIPKSEASKPRAVKVEVKEG